jgi:quinol-cytochrome oxidoreductase complex cytochrome b subunit
MGVLNRAGSLSLVLCVMLTLTACSAPSGETQPLLLGDSLYRLVVGGPSISETTLLRFYAWHVMGLGLPIILLVVWHGFRVRRDGGISSPDRAADQPAQPRVDRATLVRRDWFTFFLTIASMIVLSILVQPPLGPAAVPGAMVEHTDAPWIFLWVQELLRIWPPAIAGVLSPLVVILLLTLLPWMDWSNDGVAVWFNKQGRIPQLVLILVFLAVTGLTIRAALR